MTSMQVDIIFSTANIYNDLNICRENDSSRIMITASSDSKVKGTNEHRACGKCDSLRTRME